MKAMGLKRALSVFLTLVLTLHVLAPAAAFADERSVQVDNHATLGERAQEVSDLRKIGRAHV